MWMCFETRTDSIQRGSKAQVSILKGLISAITMASKRPHTPSSSSSTTTLVKRTRVEDEDGVGSSSSSSSLVPISSSHQGKDKGLVRSIKRTSGLSDPIIQLSGGHRTGSELLDVRFSNDGEYIAAAGADKTVCEYLRYRTCSRECPLTVSL